MLGRSAEICVTSLHMNQIKLRTSYVKNEIKLIVKKARLWVDNFNTILRADTVLQVESKTH